MTRAAPWLVRLGAALILVSPFLPQADSGGARLGALSVLSSLADKIGGVERLAAGAGLFLPVLVGLLLLAGASLRDGGPPALRLASLTLLLAFSFALATLGSIVFTDASSRPVQPSFPLLLALFAVPLLASGAALARWMQVGLDRSTGGFERGALALLVLLHGLFLADAGWGYLQMAAGVPGSPVRLLAGAWVAPLGAVLALAGSLLPRLPLRAAVDTAPASG